MRWFKRATAPVVDRRVETLQAVLYGQLRHWELFTDPVNRVDTWTLGDWTIRFYEATETVALLLVVGRRGELLLTLHRRDPERTLNVLREFDAPVDGAS